MSIFERIKVAIISKREGIKRMYCPICGAEFGLLKPCNMIGRFSCGQCGGVWETKVAPNVVIEFAGTNQQPIRDGEQDG